MSSGMKQMVINTQERAISTDINRLQTFKDRDLGELFRFMLNVSCGTDDTDAGAVATQFETIESPLRAEILNGLMMRPQQDTLNLFVDSGVMHALAPDSGAEDSNYKFISDVGVTVAGALVITSNLSAFTRIDVIECEVANTIVETDNRDIFNASTGLFTAASLTKARRGTLNYRVRAGIPNAGYPGTASGWLPLAIAHVPAGATTTNTMSFWDVRPLINDRKFSPSNISLDTQPIEFSEVGGINATTVGGTVYANLSVGRTTTFLGARRVGGRLRSSAPGVADADNFDSTASANRDGTVPAANTPIYFYLACPFGLPRWARYTMSTPRLPRSPRGLLVVSSIPPATDTRNGAPSSPLFMPTSWGLGASAVTTEAICICAGYANSAANFGGFYSRDGRHILTDSSATPDVLNPIVKTADAFSVSAGFATARFDCIPGFHFPTNAREILVEFTADLDYSAGGYNVIQILKLYETNSLVTQITNYNLTNGAAFRTIVAAAGGARGTTHATTWVVLPCPMYYPLYTVQRIDIFYDAAGFINATGAGGARMRILGWKI